MRKNSMPELREVIGGKRRKIYFQATVCPRYVIAALQNVRLGRTKVGNQGNLLTFSEENCIS